MLFFVAIISHMLCIKDQFCEDISAGPHHPKSLFEGTDQNWAQVKERLMGWGMYDTSPHDRPVHVCVCARALTTTDSYIFSSNTRAPG